MADKKKKQEVRSIYKILAVIGCVLFVVLMIVSSMGSSWITSFKAVQPGDAVTIDYTIRDRTGNPLVSSDRTVVNSVVSAGSGIFISRPLQILANQSSTTAVVPITVQYYPSTETRILPFALFGGEHDAISSALVGMKVNEQKTITIPFTSSMTQFWSAAQLMNQGTNVSDIHIGDKLSLAVSNSEVLSKNATESSYSTRIGEVTQKSAAGITLDFGYPTIEIKVVSIGGS
jgi:FKBP-type peptidyl-prolyl cis-trans isomerase 2